jgi:protein-arginine kinase activator protein McsA
MILDSIMFREEFINMYKIKYIDCEHTYHDLSNRSNFVCATCYYIFLRTWSNLENFAFTVRVGEKVDLFIKRGKILFRGEEWERTCKGQMA